MTVSRVSAERFLLVFVLQQEQGIDGSQLSHMVEEDLENLGIPKV